MPRCAAFVDAMREAFGVEDINSVIKRGLRLDAEAVNLVWFSEAGHTLGRPLLDGRPAITADRMVIGVPMSLPKRGRA